MTRSANYSPLMMKISKSHRGVPINACPFGCTDEHCDDHGYCAHLIGFYNGGTTFEPRVRRKHDGRIIVDGTRRQQMKKGYRLVKITTTARVYAPDKVKDLIPIRNQHMAELNETLETEKKIMQFADEMRNPVLEGEWDDSVYNRFASGKVAAAATTEPKS